MDDQSNLIRFDPTLLPFQLTRISCTRPQVRLLDPIKNFVGGHPVPLTGMSVLSTDVKPFAVRRLGLSFLRHVPRVSRNKKL